MSDSFLRPLVISTLPTPVSAARQEEHNRGKAGNGGKAQQDARGDQERLGLVHQLTADVGAEVFIVVRGHARDDETGGDRDEQRRDLAHQTVADGQDRIDAHRVARAHAVLGGADGNAADDVDEDDDQPGDGIAFDEFHRPVHGAVKLAFLFKLVAAGLGVLNVDHAGSHVAVDGHLFAGHGVERETRGDLGHAFGAFGDHKKVDDGQDEKDHRADDEIAGDHEIPEGLDDLARIRLQQDQPRRRDRQGEAKERGQQQDRGKGGECHHLGKVDRDHQKDRGNTQVDPDEHIHQLRRQRQDHHEHDTNQQKRKDNVIALRKFGQKFLHRGPSLKHRKSGRETPLFRPVYPRCALRKCVKLHSRFSGAVAGRVHNS